MEEQLQEAEKDVHVAHAHHQMHFRRVADLHREGLEALRYVRRDLQRPALKQIVPVVHGSQLIERAVGNADVIEQQLQTDVQRRRDLDGGVQGKVDKQHGGRQREGRRDVHGHRVDLDAQTKKGEEGEEKWGEFDGGGLS